MFRRWCQKCRKVTNHWHQRIFGGWSEAKCAECTPRSRKSNRQHYIFVTYKR